MSTTKMQANHTNRMTLFVFIQRDTALFLAAFGLTFRLSLPFSHITNNPPCQQRLPLWALACRSRQGLSPTSNHLRPQLPFKATYKTIGRIQPFRTEIFHLLRIERVTSVTLGLITFPYYLGNEECRRRGGMRRTSGRAKLSPLLPPKFEPLLRSHGVC